MKDALGHGSNDRGGAAPAAAAGIHARGTQATPQLQRRHFEAMAAELRAAPDAGSPAHAARVSAVADKLSTTNPGFRRDFFVKAATPGGAYNNKSRERSASKPGFASKVSKAKKFAGM